MMTDAIVVLDCGATNVRAIAVDTTGRIVAKSVLPNATQPSQENPAWQIWVLDEIMAKFAHCCLAIRDDLQGSGHRVVGLTVTTFGVDGALVDGAGELLYPVISWKCPRTASAMTDIRKYLEPAALQRISGVGHFPFNTIYKLIWLKENRPELLDNAASWLFISSLITQRLTGVASTDRTMAGTSQLFDLASNGFSAEILKGIGISADLFPPIVNPGDVIGLLKEEAARRLGLPTGIPVTSSGHDTQFALFGSGAGMEQPVLSSGTWEILMVRTARIDTVSLSGFEGSTCELDSRPGFYDPGLQWLGSGVVEWLKDTCWRGADGPEIYTQMIREAEGVPSGCNGVTMRPDLLVGQGGRGGGAFNGLSLGTSRGHLFRAALEALSARLACQLHELERLCGFTAQELVLVGGGSKNRLWNQLKADALRMPVKVIIEHEITVLGAAMYGLSSLGYFTSPEEARAAVPYDYRLFEPQ
jgi:L-fuculokinase